MYEIPCTFGGSRPREDIFKLNGQIVDVYEHNITKDTWVECLVKNDLGSDSASAFLKVVPVSEQVPQHPQSDNEPACQQLLRSASTVGDHQQSPCAPYLPANHLVSRQTIASSTSIDTVVLQLFNAWHLLLSPPAGIDDRPSTQQRRCIDWAKRLVCFSAYPECRLKRPSMLRVGDPRQVIDYADIQEKQKYVELSVCAEHCLAITGLFCLPSFITNVNRQAVLDPLLVVDFNATRLTDRPGWSQLLDSILAVVSKQNLSFNLLPSIRWSSPAGSDESKHLERDPASDVLQSCSNGHRASNDDGQCLKLDLEQEEYDISYESGQVDCPTNQPTNCLAWTANIDGGDLGPRSHAWPGIAALSPLLFPSSLTSNQCSNPLQLASGPYCLTSNSPVGNGLGLTLCNSSCSPSTPVSSRGEGIGDHSNENKVASQSSSTVIALVTFFTLLFIALLLLALFLLRRFRSSQSLVKLEQAKLSPNLDSTRVMFGAASPPRPIETEESEPNLDPRDLEQLRQRLADRRRRRRRHRTPHCPRLLCCCHSTSTHLDPNSNNQNSQIGPPSTSTSNQPLRNQLNNDDEFEVSQLALRLQRPITYAANKAQHPPSIPMATDQVDNGSIVNGNNSSLLAPDDLVDPSLLLTESSLSLLQSGSRELGQSIRPEKLFNLASMTQLLHPKLKQLCYPRNQLIERQRIARRACGWIVLAEASSNFAKLVARRRRLTSSGNVERLALLPSPEETHAGENGSNQVDSLVVTSNMPDDQVTFQPVTSLINDNRHPGSASSTPSSSLVVVKLLDNDASIESEANFLREAEVLIDLSHKNIIQLLGVCIPLKPLSLLLEYMPFGDLHSFLQHYDGGTLKATTTGQPYANVGLLAGNQNHVQFPPRLTSSDLVGMALGACDALCYLADCYYVHRDVATRSFLVDLRLTVKLTDFSMCRPIKPDTDFIADPNEPIPVKWLPLESILEGRFHTDTDVWSFGVLVWELFSYGLEPYADKCQDGELIEWLESGKRLSRPSNCDLLLYDLMVECWSSDRSQRPHFNRLTSVLRQL